MVDIDQLDLTDKIKAILADNEVDLEFVTYDDLLEVDGIGPTTANQIITELEAARMYPADLQVETSDLKMVTLRNNSNRKLIVPTNLVIEGYPASISRSYTFEPNEQQPVNKVDAEIMLMLRTKQANVCCGAVKTSRPVFVVV